MTSSRLLARNTALNLLGQAVPMLAAVISIPILIRALGAPRFGVLTLVWAAIGYFGLFDLGLGRALTRAVAARLGAGGGDDELGEIAWTALWLMLALGIVGGVALALLAPSIVERGLNVPAELQPETLIAFHLLVVTLPLVIWTAGLRGLLEAHQHFGLGTALRIPLALFTFLAPLLVLPFSTQLVPIVAVLCIGRALAWVAHLVVCMRQYRFLRRSPRINWHVVGPLMRSGGWMTVSNVVSPIMSYLDRFLIGAILPLVAVAYYVTPYEVVTKLLVLPLAMAGVLFPAFASTFVLEQARTAALFERSLRAVLLAMFPPLLLVVLFAREALTRWVGVEFAQASGPVLQWLAVGVFVNALAQTPYAVLQGVGRADLTAKLHLAELPLYLAALWSLAHRYGIVGVAAAWTVRAALDLVVLLLLARRLVPDPSRRMRGPLLGSAVAVAVFGAAATVQGEGAKAAFLVVALGGFGLLAWTLAVRPAERDQVRAWSRIALRRLVPPSAR